MVQCEVCHEEYPEDELELHREICVVRLVLRCSLCDGDFVSKEGLWNHLDLHEIADESKDQHYQEFKAKYKLFQCVMCNDHRAYSKSLYWNHIHDVHKGLQTDDSFSHCKARDQPVASDVGVQQVAQVTSEGQNIAFDAENAGFDFPSTSIDTGLNTRTREHSLGNFHNDEESRILSGISLNDRSDVSSEEISQLLVENPSMQQYLCRVCNTTFPTYHQIRYHKKTRHREPKHQCPHCSKKFHFLPSFEKHVLLCADLKHSCELCGKNLKTRATLMEHMKRNHRKAKARECSEKSLGKSSTSQPQSVALSNESFYAKCPYCEKDFSNGGYLPNHIEQCHVPRSCNICGMAFANAEKVRYHKKKVHSEPKHKCPDCPKIFFSTERYKSHLSICQSKEFSCNICNRKFVSYRAGITHKSSYHRGANASQKAQNCQQTESTTHSTEILKEQPDADQPTVSSHVKAVHQKICCNICEMTFARTEELQEHELTCNHRENKDGDCSEKSLEKSSSLQPQSVDLSDKKCPYCEKDFSNGANLPKHIKKCHIPRSCDFCGIGFANAQKLRYHKSKEHSKPKHKCPDCSKIFFSTERYTLHLSICQRKKFSCNICNKKFPSHRAGVAHKRNYHRDANASQKAQNCQQTESTSHSTEILKEQPDADQPSVSSHVIAVHQKICCNICEMTFACTDELKEHELTCPQNTTEYDDPQLSCKEISLLHGENPSSGPQVHSIEQLQTNSMDRPEAENIELKMEIKVEEATLLEQEHHFSNEDQRRSFAATLHPDDDKPNTIKIKEESPEEEETPNVCQSTMEPWE